MKRKPVVTRCAVVGAVVLSLAGLSACQEAPGAAAFVGDTHISVQQVQEDGAEVISAAAGLTQTPLDPSEVNRRQVNRLVTERLIIEEAERRGVTVTDSEVDKLLQEAIGTTPRSQFEGELAANQLVPPSRLDSFARTVALNQKLLAVVAPGAADDAATAAIVKELGALSTELGTGVSPRYGTWDAADLTVGLPPDDLSVPVPVASAEAQVTSGSVESN